MKFLFAKYLLSVIWIVAGVYLEYIGSETLWYYSRPLIVYYGMIPITLTIIHMCLGLASIILGIKIIYSTATVSKYLRSLTILIIVSGGVETHSLPYAWNDYPLWTLEILGLFPLIFLTAFCIQDYNEFKTFLRSFSYQNEIKRLAYDVAIILMVVFISPLVLNYRQFDFLH